MAKAQMKKVRRLRQTVETWECTARLARVWITPPDQTPYRPYIVLMVSRTGKVVGSEIVEGAPTPDQVWNVLLKTMRRPALGSGRKRRPITIHVDDEALAEALAPKLREIDVRCEYRRALPELEEALQSFEQFMSREGGEEAILGLLKSPGVTPFLVKGLFEAAASFYRAAPWQWVNDSRPIEVRYPPGSRPRLAVVMGHGGETYGLAIYNSPDDLQKVYSGKPPEEFFGEMEWTSLLFCEGMEIPFDDLDDMEKYGWPVAGDLAYPFPVRLSRSGHPFRPGKSELLWLEAALLAVPAFVHDHMQAAEGFCHPAEATLTVAMADGKDNVHLRYPVPGFEVPFEEDWAAIKGQEAEETDAARERNEGLFDVFERWLTHHGLSEKTVQRHLDHAWFFADEYMAIDGGSAEIPRPADQANGLDVDEFLGDWFLDEATWVSEGTAKASIAALKKFYTCLKEADQMPAEEADEILALLRANRNHYLELAREHRELGG